MASVCVSFTQKKALRPGAVKSLDTVYVTKLCRTPRTVKERDFVELAVSSFDAGRGGRLESSFRKFNTSLISSCKSVSLHASGSGASKQGCSFFMWRTAAPHCGPDQNTSEKSCTMAGLSRGFVRARKCLVQPPQNVAPPAKIGTSASSNSCPSRSKSALAANKCIETQKEHVRGHGDRPQTPFNLFFGTVIFAAL